MTIVRARLLKSRLSKTRFIAGLIVRNDSDGVAAAPRRPAPHTATRRSTTPHAAARRSAPHAAARRPAASAALGTLPAALVATRRRGGLLRAILLLAVGLEELLHRLLVGQYQRI